MGNVSKERLSSLKIITRIPKDPFKSSIRDGRRRRGCGHAFKVRRRSSYGGNLGCEVTYDAHQEHEVEKLKQGRIMH
jgi:hypothetical protein